MTGIWQEHRTCSCPPGRASHTTTVTVDGVNYCTSCRGRTERDNPIADTSSYRSSHSHNGQSNLVTGPAPDQWLSTSELAAGSWPVLSPVNMVGDVDLFATSVAHRGVAKFRFVTGFADPVLWLALFFAVPPNVWSYYWSTVTASVAPTVVDVAIGVFWPLVVFSVLRWPIAVARRMMVLSAGKPPAGTIRQWFPDPAGLGTYRLWNGQKWDAAVIGPVKHPSRNTTIVVVSACTIGLVALSVAMTSLVAPGWNGTSSGF